MIVADFDLVSPQLREWERPQRIEAIVDTFDRRRDSTRRRMRSD